MTRVSRRYALGALAAPFAAAAVVSLDPARWQRALAIGAELGPDDDDKTLWFEVAHAFTVDRSLVNLNNGGVSPAPTIVQRAMQRHLDLSNAAPPYTMWRILEPQKEAVRQRLGRAFGADPETIAITRNASEGLQISQFGVDLATGDEVLTTDQDYPRMLNTFAQRARREQIVLRTLPLPVVASDAASVVRLFEDHITPRTRLILACHVINLTGQILPVAEISRLGRRHGIPVIIDGAHALANLVFRLDDIGCDYYATSLHKWLFAPHGTGLLYVRRDRIGRTWPLMAAAETQDDDIRKFEEIGTHPAANTLAISEALTFHEGIGPQRKYERLIRLRNYWAERLVQHDRVRLHTSLIPGLACGLANMQVDGIPSVELNNWLWKQHRILTTVINHERFEGVRVSPSVFTTFEELDRFCDAIDHAISHGLG